CRRPRPRCCRAHACSPRGACTDGARAMPGIDPHDTAAGKGGARAAPAVSPWLAKPVDEVPAGTLTRLRDAARGCRRCPLWRNATQTVFGAGPSGARLMLVGEQPGDREDLAGEPFVGPAGRVLREAL